MRKIFLAILGTLLFLTPSFLSAQSFFQLDYPRIPGGPLLTPGASLQQFITYLYRLSLVAGALLAFGMILYQGVRYLTAGENFNRLQEAKEGLISAFLGLTVILGSAIILNILDPNLLIFQVQEIPIFNLPEIQRTQLNQPRPSQVETITSFEEDTKNLIDFLEHRIWPSNLSPEELNRFINTIVILLDIESLYNDLKWAQQRDCSQTRTFCVPKLLSPVLTGCVWFKDGKKVDIQEELMLKMKTNSLNKLRLLIEELVKSEEAKKLGGTLRKLNSCLADKLKNLRINEQAKAQGDLDYFKITNQDPLYFYCFQ
jgi:hypothetical protein